MHFTSRARPVREAATITAAAVFVAMLAPASRVLADVTFDGSLGGAGTRAGSSIRILPNDGRSQGGNLFHSFSKFDINRGQRVTFTGPTGTKNVIARVTGGTPSRIDGVLGSEIPNANLFLLNPSGVIFGPSGRLSVSGSFTVSTADTLGFADGAAFRSSLGSGDSVLSSDLPSSFGFLTAQAGGISVQSRTLSVPKEKNLSLVASGNIAITPYNRGRNLDPDLLVTPTLGAADGRINLVAVRSPGTVELNTTDLSSGLRLRTFTELGDISIQGQNTSISVNGESGGKVAVRAARLDLTGSRITANTEGAGDGSGIEITLTKGFHSSLRGGVLAETSGTGQGGDIDLTAPFIEASAALIENAEQSGIATGTFGMPDDTGTKVGTAGDVKIEASVIRLTSNGKIGSESYSRDGDGGDVDIQASTEFTIDGFSEKLPGEALAREFLTGVSTRVGPGIRLDAEGVETLALNRGRGGDMSIVTPRLRITRGGRITSEVGDISKSRRGGDGIGGIIRIDADTFVIDGFKTADPATPSGITADSLENTTGSAGDVSISSDRLQILNAGAIRADTRGTGAAGLINIDARDITVRGLKRFEVVNKRNQKVVITSRSRISSQTSAEKGGRGGSLFINASTLSVDSGGRVAASTTLNSGGSAGRIQITGDLVAVGRGGVIQTNTETDSQGGAGDIVIGTRFRPVGHLFVNGGEITAASFGSGNGGNISGRVVDLTVQRNGRISVQSGGLGATGEVKFDVSGETRLLSPNAIISSARLVDGGDITLRPSSMEPSLTMVNSSIVSSAEAAGRDGGDILFPFRNRVVLSNSSITTSSKGGGGNITLEPETIVFRNAQIRADAGTEDGGNITIGAENYFRDLATQITAFSELSLPGTIAVSAAEVDLTGALLTLRGDLASNRVRLQEQCAPITTFDASSFTLGVRGGTAIEPGTLVVSPKRASNP